MTEEFASLLSTTTSVEVLLESTTINMFKRWNNNNNDDDDDDNTGIDDGEASINNNDIDDARRQAMIDQCELKLLIDDATHRNITSLKIATLNRVGLISNKTLYKLLLTTDSKYNKEMIETQIELMTLIDKALQSKDIDMIDTTLKSIYTISNKSFWKFYMTQSNHHAADQEYFKKKSVHYHARLSRSVWLKSLHIGDNDSEDIRAEVIALRQEVDTLRLNNNLLQEQNERLNQQAEEENEDEDEELPANQKQGIVDVHQKEEMGVRTYKYLAEPLLDSNGDESSFYVRPGHDDNMKRRNATVVSCLNILKQGNTNLKHICLKCCIDDCPFVAAIHIDTFEVLKKIIGKRLEVNNPQFDIIPTLAREIFLLEDWEDVRKRDAQNFLQNMRKHWQHCHADHQWMVNENERAPLVKKFMKEG